MSENINPADHVEVVEVTGYTARCKLCPTPWESNWAPSKDDADLHLAEHVAWHEQQLADEAEG